ncbi:MULTISPECIES: SDR family NAD(P)-dependent oxidoreductase [unclassified Variovorax]|uniref:SDR family NAD(P)-dependent oxidoreductase n=1 Tax=unclassified Variovorax TaxID=663243 RepID=UPI0008C32639|nr:MULTISPECIES: SDR family NAD(P)-dependent oxidoreductase [unclassified Variovorax]SEK17322.1 Short-chain dehydrogenase [Variovorax sp. OK202]SFE79424.1 Short-chain dehydrogenase [Variovorax sp. OK212]
MGATFLNKDAAPSGIGLELARCCAAAGFDLLAAAGEPDIEAAAQILRSANVQAQAQALQVDLSTMEGVDRLYATAGGRPVDALLANAGRGHGHGFLDEDFTQATLALDAIVTGMLYARSGRVLITGSIAGFMPGSFQAVYNGTKAFIDSFSFALRDELKESEVNVTCLMPGPTDTEFFEGADMLDTKVGQAEKADRAKVANIGFEAMLDGEGDVVAGWKNKLQTALGNSSVLSDDATSLIRLVVQGGRGPRSTSGPPPQVMPGFDLTLTDVQTAQVLTYVRQSWGNMARPVTTNDVTTLKRKLR